MGFSIFCGFAADWRERHQAFAAQVSTTNLRRGAESVWPLQSLSFQQNEAHPVRRLVSLLSG